ncbi:jmjC domain-containing protein 4-like isoform X2 [Centruroides sculpturatus]|nr:jmjC domain-containing protein 4-like isoform X2 [Centruroides sculpturatus]
MSVKNYISYWKRRYYSKGDSPCLYLKDWHFVRTPFHADVFGSYSWSANICGRKKWLLVPPEKEKIFSDSTGKLLFDIKLDSLNKLDVLEVIQEPGEIIFVPSGWHHQVWNLADTISINHNWFNGCNINYICKQLHFALKEVQKEIADCKDMDYWDLQCQIILKTHHGMDLKEFCQLLQYIGNRSITNLSRNKSNSDVIWHNVFDLLKVQEALQYILNENLLNFDLKYEEDIILLNKLYEHALVPYNLLETV